MPKIADLPEFEGELTGAEKIIVEDADATKQASVGVLATRAQLLSVTPTSGNLLSRTSAVYEYANGAIPIIRGGRRVGWTVPVGATAIGTNVVPFMPLEYDTVRRLKGVTVRIRTIIKATLGYLDMISFGGNAVQVRRRNGSLDSNVGVQIGQPYQQGEQLVRDFAYVMQGDEVAFAATMQVGGGHEPVTQELSFEIVSVSWDVVAALPLEGAPVGVDMMLDTRLAALSPSLALFDRIEGVEDVAYLQNGATVLRDARDRALGLTVPVGASGLGGIMQWRHVLNGRKRALLAGTDVFVVLGFNTSADWNRPHVLNMQARTIGLAAVDIETSNLFDAQLSATRRVMAFSFVMPAGVTLDDLRPFLRLSGADPATTEESIILTDMSVQILRTKSDIAKAAEQTGALVDESARADAVRQAVATIDGTGARIGRRLKSSNFASIAAALMQATILAGAGDVAAVIVPAGNFAEHSLGLIGSGTDGNHIALRGAGIGRTNIIGRLPANTDPAVIRATSTLDFNATQDIEGLTAIGRNCRYVVHGDAVKFKPDSRLTYRNVEGIHEGNDEADAYHQTSVWASQHAFAFGTCSGSYYLFDSCRGTAPRAAFSAHNQVDFADPSKIELVNSCWTATKAGGWSVRLESIGSRVMDRCIMRGNMLSGEVSLAVTPWYPTALADQPADRREWEIVGFGNSPAAFRPESWSRALRIVSAATGPLSKIEISGTAELILFTRQAIERTGDVGLAGDAYSWGCVQDQVGVGPNRNVFITGLGKRLGDRTAAPVTLSVKINGGATVHILFNQDFTAWTNAQVLAFINDALAGAAVASEYDVEGLYRPFLMDEEASLQNVSGTAILKGMVLARDATGARNVRPMTADDDQALFAGVAWETIRPGAYGRVKTSGWLPELDLLRSDGGVLNVGEWFRVDRDRPGYVRSGVKGSGLLRIVRPSLNGFATLEVGSSNAATTKSIAPESGTDPYVWRDRHGQKLARMNAQGGMRSDRFDLGFTPSPEYALKDELGQKAYRVDRDGSFRMGGMRFLAGGRDLNITDRWGQRIVRFGRDKVRVMGHDLALTMADKIAQQPAINKGLSHILQRGPAQLLHWRMARAAVIQGVGRRLLIGIGDSNMMGWAAEGAGNHRRTKAFLRATCTMLAGVLPTVETSFFGQALTTVTTSAYVTYDPRLTFGAGWAIDGSTSLGGVAFRNTTTTEALAVNPGTAWTTAEIYVSAATDGTLSFDIGGAVTTHSITAGAFQRLVYTVPAGTNILNIRRVSGTVEIVGGFFHDAARPSICGLNMGRSGWRSSDWVARIADIVALLAYESHPTVILELGLNDLNQDVDPAVFKANMEAIIVALRGAGADVVMQISLPPGVAKSHDWRIYVAAQYDLAAKYDLAVSDMTSRLASYAAGTAAGFINDSLHLNQFGYADKACSAFALLTSV